MSKIGKLFFILITISIALGLMFYSSRINFQWEYFQWLPFLELVAMLFIPNFLVFLYMIRKNKKNLNDAETKK